MGRSIGDFALCTNGKVAHDAVVVAFGPTCLSADRDYIDAGKVLPCGGR